MDDLQNVIDNFSLIFIDKKDKEKIILKLDSKNTHYTLHFGTKSKVLDIHKTIELPGNEKNYETIIKINHFTLGRVVFVLKGMINLVESTFFNNKVNSSFLRRYKIIAQSLDEIDLNNTQVMDFNEKKAKLKFNKDGKMDSLLNLFIPINKEMKAAPYMLWKNKRGNLTSAGLLFVVYTNEGNKQFYYTTKKMYNLFIKTMFLKILTTLESNASLDNNIYSELKTLYEQKYNKYLI